MGASRSENGSDAVRDAYLAAFDAANPDAQNRPVPTYEHGWWCFRYAGSDFVDSKYREAKLLEMTDKLCRRAQDDGA